MERSIATMGPPAVNLVDAPTADATPEAEERLANETAQAFAEANREHWDSPEEDAAWADW